MSNEELADMPSEQKPILKALSRENPKTKEGKYLVMRRDGTIPKWPSFVLGARDPHAVVALRAYADSIATDPDCDPGLVESIKRMADEWDKYREEHGKGDPTRGLHRVDNPLVILLMQQGASA